MESTEFDVTLGGTEQLPRSTNSLKFASSRSVEIAAMTECILRPSKTKLVFQSLPAHMRRRVMSHNSKRLPRRLRQAHLEQLKKSGLPPKQKRPSRKYRRRPANLLEEYNRRQKRNVWLETHIWHAKRFHMIERWCHRLPLAPCDKAFRACYRASSAHSLLQDISYYTPMRLSGPLEKIQRIFSSITSFSCGLSIVAKAYISGNREGEIHLYGPHSYPLNYIGKVKFLWEPNTNNNKTLWLFVHPSYSKQVESMLTDLLLPPEKNEDSETAMKKRKITDNNLETIQFKVLPGAFNRFRFTGPNSHAILTKSLKCVELDKIKNNKWVEQHQKMNYELYLQEKKDYWTSINSVSSPSQLPPRIVVGLVVKDPRLMRPTRRSKALPEVATVAKKEVLANIPQNLSVSPLWNTDIHKMIKSNVMTNGQFVQHVTKLNLVPGEIWEDDPELQSVPIVLIQRPGSQESSFKKIGYGSGWDIIIPSGYGMAFWLTFIMFGGRSGGLRETESLAFEMGECYLPPDSEAGQQNEKRIELELRERYFRLPPSKRVNYVKLGINSPFICPWKLLLKDWTDKPVNDFYVMRDWRLLDEIQECVKRKKQLSNVKDSHLCLVAVYLHLSVGNLRRHALICLPKSSGDQSKIKNLFEAHHEDPNEILRRNKRKEHLVSIKKLRQSRIKSRKKSEGSYMNSTKKQLKKKNEPSEYVKVMRELWLPSTINSVRNIGSRDTIGFVTQGAFSFTEAQSCGVGYVTFTALNKLLQSGLNQVLVRNTSSRKYRLANIEVIKSV